MDPALVLFGATGDLAGRMLLPSLVNLERDGLLPPGLRVIASGRARLDAESFAALIAPRAASDADAFRRLKDRLSYVPVDAADASSFEALRPLLSGASERVFYLSTSPSLYGPVTAGLGAAGLVDARSRVVLEKPIGKDLGSSREVNEAVGAVFAESQIFRVDHYLGKETVQNLIALRFANTIFEPLWNAQSIDHVQITVAETLGVEGRGDYYDEYGALRDMVQNHVLQLLCLVAMEPPARFDPDSVRNEKVKVLRCLKPIAGGAIAGDTIRGQYAGGLADGAAARGYVEELGRPSDTETFVALRCEIENWRWAGVPFYLRTGKRLPERRTEIVIQFRRPPHSIFGAADIVPNQLVIRLQPQEEVALRLMNKTPGLAQDGMRLRPLSLNLSLSDAFDAVEPRRRIAYERLILDALAGNPTLFVRRDEVEAAWAWVDPIIAAWKSHGAPKRYAAGSWGPSGVYALIERSGRSWND